MRRWRGQGERFRPTPGKLPEKKPGEHRWVMTAMYSLTDTQARMVMRNEDVILSDENLITVEGPGCIDCEELFKVIRDTPCPAGDTWPQ